MTDVKRARRWFQFHLASAVVMLVVAGGLVGKNLKLRDGGPEHYRPFSMGWPSTFAFEVYKFDGGDPGTPKFGHFEWRWRLFPAAAINVAVGLGIVIAAGVAAETVLRFWKRAPAP